MITTKQPTLKEEALEYVREFPGHELIRRLPKEYKHAMTQGFVAFREQYELDALESKIRNYVIGLQEAAHANRQPGPIPSYRSADLAFNRDVHLWRLHLERWWRRRQLGK